MGIQGFTDIDGLGIQSGFLRRYSSGSLSSPAPRGPSGFYSGGASTVQYRKYTVCVRACVRACVCACVRACVRACACVRVKCSVCDDDVLFQGLDE